MGIAFHWIWCWYHDMEMIFKLLILCEGNPQVTCRSPLVMQSFHIFFVVIFNKLLNKQSSFPWSEKPQCSCDKSNGAGKYCQISNISNTLTGNKIVDRSDVVGASSVGAAPTTSSFLTLQLASVDWVKTTGRRDKNHSSLGIQCILY